MKSNNVLELFEDVELKIKSARVNSVSDNEIILDIHNRMQVAQLAFSCVIRPEPGDLVLYSSGPGGPCFILGIIERPGKQDMSLTYPGNVNMNINKGSLGLRSRNSINIVAQEQINHFSKETIHKSKEAIIDIDKITAKGESFHAVFKSMNIIGQMVTRLTKRLLEKTKSYIRRTEDYDEIQAGQMTRKSENLLSIKSKNTVMISDNETVIDGKHIFTGL